MRYGVNRWMGLMLACLLAGACAKQPQSTRLTLGDFNETVAQMTASLARSEFLRERGPDSPPVVVVINKVENLTTDVIPVREQWMLMARVRGALPVLEMGKQKNIRFALEPERQKSLRQMGFEGDLGQALQPTHLMSATFRSSPRTGRQDKGGQVDRRSEYYYLEYSITSLESRQVVWTDRFEFKREAVGLAID